MGPKTVLRHLRDVEQRIAKTRREHPNGTHVEPWLTLTQAAAIIEAIRLLEEGAKVDS